MKKHILIISTLLILLVFIGFVVFQNNKQDYEIDFKKTISDFYTYQEDFIVLKDFLINQSIGYELKPDNISNISDPNIKRVAEKIFNELNYSSIIKTKDPYQQDPDFDIIFLKKNSQIKSDEKIIFAINTKSYEGLIKKLDNNWFYSVQTYT